MNSMRSAKALLLVALLSIGQVSAQDTPNSAETSKNVVKKKSLLSRAKSRVGSVMRAHPRIAALVAAAACAAVVAVGKNEVDKRSRARAKAVTLLEAYVADEAMSANDKEAKVEAFLATSYKNLVETMTEEEKREFAEFVCTKLAQINGQEWANLPEEVGQMPFGQVKLLEEEERQRRVELWSSLPAEVRTDHETTKELEEQERVRRVAEKKNKEDIKYQLPIYWTQ